MTTTSTTLTVSGDDDGGEANLTYSWSIVSAPVRRAPGSASTTATRRRTPLSPSMRRATSSSVSRQLTFGEFDQLATFT